jgi:hypothetical protein
MGRNTSYFESNQKEGEKQVCCPMHVHSKEQELGGCMSGQGKLKECLECSTSKRGESHDPGEDLGVCGQSEE